MKMKRNEVKMTVSKALKEIKRELAVRAGVYPKWIEQKKLAQVTAAERYVALDEIRLILELMERKQLSFEELRSLLNAIHAQPKAQQGKMQFGSGNYSPKNPI